MNKITNTLIHKGYLKTDAAIDAFADIPRDEFVPDRLRSVASVDMPLPVGAGYMMPAMSVAAFMVELLQVQRGFSVLIMGHGSGWITAIMSYMVGSQGHVTSLGTSKKLAEDSLRNISKFHFIERDHIVDMHTIDTCADIELAQKYDRILVLSPELISCINHNFLKKDGKIVFPENNIITLIDKHGDNNVEKKAFSGMQFLPQ